MNLYTNNHILGVNIPKIYKNTPTETKKAITRATNIIFKEKEVYKKLLLVDKDNKKTLNRLNKLKLDRDVLFKLSTAEMDIKKKLKFKKQLNNFKKNISIEKNKIRDNNKDIVILNKALEKIKIFKEQIKEFNGYEKTFKEYISTEENKKILKEVHMSFILFYDKQKRWKPNLKKDEIGQYGIYRARMTVYNFNTEINRFLFDKIALNRLYEQREPKNIFNQVLATDIMSYLNMSLSKIPIKDKKREDDELFWALYHATAIKILDLNEGFIENGIFHDENMTDDEEIEYFSDVEIEGEYSVICDSKYNEFELNSDTFIKPYYMTNDYLRENYIPNSCALTALIYIFGKRFSDLGYKTLTYEKIAEKMQIEINKSNNPIKIEHLRNFIKNCNLKFKIVLLDAYFNIIETITNTNVKSEITAYFQLYDKHLTPLLHNTKSLEQLLANKKLLKSKISQYYSHFTYKRNELEKEIYISDLNGFLQHIEKIRKNEPNTDKIIYKLYVSNEFENRKIFFYMINHHNYKPTIKTQRGSIVEIRFNSIKGNKIVIKSMIDDVEGINILDTVEDIEENKIIEHINISKNCENEFYNYIVNPKYISSFNNETQKIHNLYKISIEKGIYKEIDDKIELFGLDDVKAYSSRLNEIEWITQIDFFDNYKEYSGIIKDNNYYIIEYLTTKQDKIDYIVFNGYKITRVLGLLLKYINPKKYKILYELNTKKINVSFKEGIRKIYDNTELTEAQKKFIINKIIGCLGIKNNTSTKSNVFKTFKEALAHKKILAKMGKNGEITEFKDFSGLENTNDYEPLYLIQEYEKKQTINNYTPIHEMILTLQKIRIIKNIIELERIKIPVLGIKTDCLYIDVKHLNNVVIQNKIGMRSNPADFVSLGKKEKNLELYSTLGGYKIDKEIKAEKNVFTMKDNENLKLYTDDNINKKIFEDEYNINEIKKYIETAENILISAKYAGCGKSYICKQLSKNKNEILFITPTNVLSLEYKKDGYKSKTIHKYLGVNFELTKQTRPKTDNEIKYIIFDEIYLFEYELLKLIYKKMMEEQNIKYLATGDPNQRDAIGSNPKEIIKAVNYIFRNQIYLKVIKRQNKEQIKTIEGIYNGIFVNNNYDPEFICNKYNIKMITDGKIKTNKHITYFKEEAERQNKNVLEKLGKNKYEKNNYLLVKKSKLNGDVKLYMNYRYKIIENKKEKMTLLEEFEGIEYTFTTEFVDEYFKNDYSQTLDSLQGLTIREPYTIHNTQSYKYIDKKFIWTALTRADNLENVYISINKNNTEDLEADLALLI